MNPLKTYLEEMNEIRSTGAGVDETSYYGPLEELLDAVGKKLKPKVHCVMQLADIGAGHPDGGFFSTSQSSDQWLDNPDQVPVPDRGAIEVKPPSVDVWETARSKQVLGYLKRYRLVLITNFRHFLLVKPDEQGQPERLGEYIFAPTEAAFWTMAAHPGKKEVKEKAKELAEFLKRVMYERAPLYKPEDVAWFLAFYAKEALKRIEEKAELPELASIKEAMEEALGLKFEHGKKEEREKGKHFFRSSLVQTLFYGIFSAWIYWHKEDGKGDFNWHDAPWFQHVPVIRALFGRLATPSHLELLGLIEVLDWAGDALKRVEPEFFKRFEEEHAVQYFYEPFLKAYDPELRNELGVWYTPPEIVRYMVERVDRVLRSELDIDDGLADDRVYVLDPCCGTGAYLVQVLERIKRTYEDKGEGDLCASLIKKAAQERVFGFEILPAPLVVAHLQLGLKLDSLGAPLGKKERVGVYLTNALTGWEPPEGAKKQLEILEFQKERDKSDEIKQEARILVILGNPPYNAFAGVSQEEEMIPSTDPDNPEGKESLVQTYKRGIIDVWGIKKFNLDDFYIRFFRIAERRIVEKTKKGIVCFISNFSYLGDPSFVVMRERFLSEFDKLWFDCMNGDSRETGKRTPDGKPDPSVFSTKQSPVGIRVGTAIGLLTRKPSPQPSPTGRGRRAAACEGNPSVRFRHFWGVTKKENLEATLKEEDEDKFNGQYEIAHPDKSNRYSFRPGAENPYYEEWPILSELSRGSPFVGLEECRGGALIDIDRADLEERMKAYYDSKIELNQLRTIIPRLTQDSSRFNAKKTREKILKNEEFMNSRVMPFLTRPFDSRYCYYTPIRSLWNEPRPDLWKQCWPSNLFIVSRFHCQATPEGIPMYISTGLFDKQTISRNPGAIPIRIRPQTKKTPKEQAGQTTIHKDDTAEVPPIANLSPTAREYLKSLGITNPDKDAETAGLVWMHALAIGYSPTYLEENADGIRQDWPRIPLPASKELLEASAALGRKVAKLLDTEEEVKTVTSGIIRPELKVIGVIKHVEGKNLNPDKGHLEITASWGHPGKGGVTMPGKGRYEEREYTEEERQAIVEGAKALGISAEEALNRLGETTFDVYLNDVAYWRNVPKGVWEYYIGGYQVIKKWLSYREKRMLGRGISIDETVEVRDMARRLGAIILLEPQLDENYQRVKKEVYKWVENEGRLSPPVTG